MKCRKCKNGKSKLIPYVPLNVDGTRLILGKPMLVCKECVHQIKKKGIK